jgi:signal transduction histidine kinase
MTGSTAPTGRWLLRSYVFLAGGLLIAAVLLEFAFSRIQAQSLRAQDPWLRTAGQLIESRLLATPTSERETLLAQFHKELGMPVSLLDGGDIVTPRAATDSSQRVLDAHGQEYQLFYSARLGQVIRIGPIASQADSRWLTLLPVAFYASILIVVGLWLRPLLRDIRILTTAAQRFAADYREPLATAKQTTELTSLAHNLDDMSRRIGSLIQNQRDLTAALSHEMRTPLARMRFALAVLPEDAEPSLQAQLQELNADIQEIDRLIAALLNYVRLDHPDVQMNLQDTPLRPWLQAIVNKAALPGRTINVEQIAPESHARMDARLMELLVSNLLVNACRYARSCVRIRCECGESENRISVEDDGPGIPPQEREQVFRAFTRLDTSRNRETGGYGLGLAIVARIAALHGGAATVAASDSLGGAQFTVTWPANGVARS